MTFHDLEIRLLGRLRDKVGRGEISERQLARRAGYTQPHIHNVLKGIRGLSPELADAALRCLEMSVDDLLDPGAPAAQLRAALWRGVVGLRHRFPQASDPAGFRLFPQSFLSQFEQPALLRVAPEESAMEPLIAPGDLVLMDRAEDSRRRPVFDRVHVLGIGGAGTVCRCQVVGQALVLVSDNSRPNGLPDHIPLARRDILDVVKGRVVWICRELDLL